MFYTKGQSGHKAVIAILLGLIIIVGGFFIFRPGSHTQEKESRTQEKEKVGRVSSTPDSQIDRAVYLPYTQPAFNQALAEGKRRLYFFHASWCPTCRFAEKDIIKNIDKLPSDLVIFKVNYDRESALKTKYGVTYQHTFVQVDEDGRELAKWNGGAVDEILSNLK